MSLEEREKELYGMRDEKTAKEIIDLSASKNPNVKEAENGGIKNTWNKKEADSFDEDSITSKALKKVTFYTKLTFWLIILGVLAGGGFLYYFINQYSKSKDLGFDVSAPSRVMIAKPFEISVDLENKSQSILKQPKILVSLPDGAISLDNKNPDMQTYEESLDDLNPGAVIHKKYEVVLLKDEQSIKKFNVNFSYVPNNLNTRFERDQEVDVVADQPAISLSLATPQKVFNDETFEMNVNYQDLSDIDFQNAKLQMVYPNNFVFATSSVQATSSNNIWAIDNISKSDGEKNISIKGSLSGADQSFFEIKSQLYVTFSNKQYLINEKVSNLSIASSPLSLAIVLNNDPNYISGPGDNLHYQITYHNNTDVGLNDVIIKAKLSGEMFDLSSLQTKGSLDSSNNTITWNAGNMPELKILQQNAQGFVDFNIRTKPQYTIKRMFDKNFSLKIDAEIDSPTVPYNVSSDKTTGIASLETKMKGRVDINISLEKLKGPYPMQVGKTTTFNIHWAIKNYSTDIKDVKVDSILQSDVKWLNVVKSNGDTIPMYNDRTGEIVWQIPRIIATKGIISSPLEAVFQVEATPNVTQAGQQFPFLSNTTLSATDEFTNLQINASTDYLKADQNVAN